MRFRHLVITLNLLYCKLDPLYFLLNKYLFFELKLFFVGYLAVFSVASCTDTWSLFRRTEDEQLLLFALTEVDCPRLPRDSSITVTHAVVGQELPQLFLDLRTQKAMFWKSAIILHDDTLSKYP